MENLKRRIGKKLRARREEMGFPNQSEFSEKVGVDNSRVSRWETGASLPKGKYRQKVMELLQVDDSFFDPSDDMLSDIGGKTIGEMTPQEFEMTVLPKINNLPIRVPRKQKTDIAEAYSNIPRDILDLLADKDQRYFDSLRRSLTHFKKTEKPKKKKV